MPIYAYKCKNCEHRFEVRQRFSDDTLTECPVCSGNIRRVISPVGVVFKGSGFYVTDNRNGKSNGAVTASSKKQDKESASKTGESDTKKTTDGEKSNVASDKSKGSSDSAQNSASV